MNNEITVFAPASVANVGCGYDVLGFALEDLGDIISIRKSPEPGLRIIEIDSKDKIPFEAEKNVATVAVNALLAELGKDDVGYEFKIQKMVKAGSGLGSSASSSAAAVFGVNELLGKPFGKKDLVKFAGEGEKAASGKTHYDNVAASVLGGFTLVRSRDPLDIIALNYPTELFVVIAHPQVEIKTADARKILREQIPISDAVTQWANLSGFTVGLLKSDYDLMGRSLEDVIAEPIRSMLIPYYEEAKSASLQAGALGCNIAGSGPSIFSFCQGKEVALKVRDAVKTIYSKSSMKVNYHLSTINPEGAKVL